MSFFKAFVRNALPADSFQSPPRPWDFEVRRGSSLKLAEHLNEDGTNRGGNLLSECAEYPRQYANPKTQIDEKQSQQDDALNGHDSEPSASGAIAAAAA
jgi:hypothetical protein